MKENNCNSSRRNFLQYLGWATTLGTMGGFTWASARFMFPNVLYEPRNHIKYEGRKITLKALPSFRTKRFLWCITETNLRLYQPCVRTLGVHPTG